MKHSKADTDINENSLPFLKNEMQRILDYTLQKDCIAAGISSVTVGWHLDHILLTINQIYNVLEKSNPKDFVENPNLGKSMLFASGKMPRGKIKTSESLNPTEVVTLQRINRDYETAIGNILRFDSLHQKAHLNHFSLGALKRENAKRFLVIHTNHHLNIISDIVKTTAQ